MELRYEFYMLPSEGYAGTPHDWMKLFTPIVDHLTVALSHSMSGIGATVNKCDVTIYSSHNMNNEYILKRSGILDGDGVTKYNVEFVERTDENIKVVVNYKNKTAEGYIHILNSVVI